MAKKKNNILPVDDLSEIKEIEEKEQNNLKKKKEKCIK
jgi:hypothetical protein